jgi:trimeric autotransporter adhesin
MTPWIRAHLAVGVCLVLLLALAAPAGAVTHAQASSKALNALGTKRGAGPVIVFALRSASPARARVTQSGSKKLLLRAVRERTYFVYEDLGPFRGYPHPGRVALVGAKSGKVHLSKVLSRAPRVNGRLPVFLRSSAAYRSSSYRIFARLGSTLAQEPASPTSPGAAGPNMAPKADPQSVVAKLGHPKHIVLTASDANGDFLLFAITNPPTHGTLSGAPPDLVYTPDPGFLGKDKFAFRAYDDSSQSNTAHVTVDVRPLGSPPSVTTSAGCTAYNAGATAVVVDGLSTVSDPDDTTLDSATVTIASNFQGGDDLLFTDQSGISGSYDDGSGTLTLSGTASVAAYQAAIRTVRYRNLTTNNPAATKNITFSVNDAGNDAALATKQVCIAQNGGPNRRPTGDTTSEGPLVYTENDGPVPVDPAFGVVDPDGGTLSGATIRFTTSQNGIDEELGGGGGGSVFNFFPGEDRLGFVNQNGITGSYSSSTGVLTLSGSASIADYQTALQSVTYENTSENPAADVRTVRFQITDSAGATSVPSTRDVYVTPVNDAPTVTTSSGATAYTEGDAATAVDAAVNAGDVDNTTLSGGKVRISNGFQAGDTLAFSDQNGISGSYDSGTGVLTLTGSASVADYQAALRSIQFHQTSDAPTTSKTVEFVVNDGELDSAAATKNIAVAPVNDAPVLTAGGGTLSYGENAGPVAVDPAVTASDVDSATFAGATVRISGGFSSTQDQLAFTNQNGITGSYDSRTGVLTLTGTAPVADYQSALRSVTYENTSDNPSTDTRTVTFQVDDGGATANLSNSVTRDVSVTPSNDAPSVTTSGGSTSYTAGDTTGVAVDAGVVASDIDDTNLESAQVRISSGFQSGDELVFVGQAGITGSYDGGTGVLALTGSASVEDYQAALASITFRSTSASAGDSRTVEFVVNDGDADSAAATKTIDVVAPPANDPPVVTTTSGSTSYGNGDPAVAVDPGVTVTDADDTNLEGARVRISAGFDNVETLGFTDQNGIFGTYDGDNGILTLTGTASVADYQAALQSITIRTSGTVLQPSKTIEFVVNDGDADSAAATKTVDVGPPTF